MKDTGRVINVIDGVELDISELHPDSNSLRIRLWSSGTVEFAAFQFEFACIYPPFNFEDDDYEVIVIPSSAKLFKVTVLYELTDEAKCMYSLVAKFYFWASDQYRPLLIADCHLMPITMLALTAHTPTPEGISLA